MKIQAALLLEAHQPFIIEEVELDEPRAGEVLVKIKASGVCHSDYHLVSGATKHPMPVVIGHEGAGVVEAVGAGINREQHRLGVARNVLEGDREIGIATAAQAGHGRGAAGG